MRALFDLLRGPGAGLGTKGVYWRGRLVTAVDGTMMCCPDTAANLRVYRKGGGHHGGTGYPMIRMLALVACGTRTIIDATFGTSSIGETTYTRDLLRALHSGMIVLADRNFACQALIAEIVDTGADVLVRVKNSPQAPGLPPVAQRLLRVADRPGRGPSHLLRDHHRHHRRPPDRGLPAGHHDPRPRLPRR